MKLLLFWCKATNGIKTIGGEKFNLAIVPYCNLKLLRVGAGLEAVQVSDEVGNLLVLNSIDDADETTPVYSLPAGDSSCYYRNQGMTEEECAPLTEGLFFNESKDFIGLNLVEHLLVDSSGLNVHYFNKNGSKIKLNSDKLLSSDTYTPLGMANKLIELFTTTPSA